MKLLASRACTHCGSHLSLRDSAVHQLRGRSQRRCRPCRIQVSKSLRRFAHEFRLACEDGVITSEEWHSLWVKLQPSGVTQDEALAFIREDAIKFLQNVIEAAFADGEISVEEEAHFRRMVSILEICPKDMMALRARWDAAVERGQPKKRSAKSRLIFS